MLDPIQLAAGPIVLVLLALAIRSTVKAMPDLLRALDQHAATKQALRGRTKRARRRGRRVLEILKDAKRRGS